jgi:tetratricopeptide (TPR) repeat protein
MMRFPMRALVLALAALLALPAAAAAQRDFVSAYKDGEDAFKKGNDALAEQKFKEARSHPRAPRQSRKANLAGVVFEPFIPDYYLGVIAARQGRYQEAATLLEGALRDGLITEKQRAEYALATSSLERARDQIRLASNTRPNAPVEPIRPPPSNTTTTAPPPPATTTTTTATPGNPSTATPSTSTGPGVTPSPVRPPPLPVATEPAWLPGFRRSMDAARSALRQSRYAEARSSLASASSVAGDAARRQEAELLGRDIDAAQTIETQQIVNRARVAIRRKDVSAALTQVASLESLAPRHAALPELRNGIDQLRGALQGMADLARVERLGVKLFLSGNYKASGDELQRAVGAGVTSPRIYLFLASSRAAEALLAPQSERDALVEQARKAYALAKPGTTLLAADERFISPSILQLLKSS